MRADQSGRSKQVEKPPVSPIYQPESPSEPIKFGDVRLQVTEGGNSEARSAIGHAQLRFVPDERVEIVIPRGSSESSGLKWVASLMSPVNDTVKLTLQEHGGSFEAIRTLASSESVTYIPKQSPTQVYPKSQSISTAVFHLLNWPDFRGAEDLNLRTGEGPHFGATRCGHFILEIAGWTVTVTAMEDTHRLVTSLKELGGYVVTHVGEIRRSNYAEFSADQLDEQLTLLSYFFSLVLGRWSGPSLVVGTDATGCRVYEQWGLGRCASGSWRGSDSWFDLNHSEFFGALLPGFANLWSNPIWHPHITDAIYWYINANQGGRHLGVDTSLLFTQAALELLSWTTCVLDRQLVSENAFSPRGLSAADKLRLLVSSLNIPLEIPPGLTALHSRKGRKWDDSMDAITEIRNGLVHPGKERALPEGAYFDAWRLSLWYLDLVFLRLCSYSGTYANRLSQRFVGVTEQVPWISQDTSEA